MDVCLIQAMQRVRPVGPRRHFRMLTIHTRFNRSHANKKRVTISQLWERINFLWNVEALSAAEARQVAAENTLENGDAARTLLGVESVDFQLHPHEEYAPLAESVDRKKRRRGSTSHKRGANDATVRRKSSGGQVNKELAALSSSALLGAPIDAAQDGDDGDGDGDSPVTRRKSRRQKHS